MGENTQCDKFQRDYKRLLVAILERQSANMLERILRFINFTYREYNINLQDAIHDSKNYIIHYQAGRTILVCKDSPLAKKIIADGEEAEERNETRKLQQRMRDSHYQRNP